MKDEVEQRLKEAIEQKSALRGLLGHPGWDIMKTVFAQWIADRTDRVVLLPVGTIQDGYQQEFMKGEVAAMRLLLEYPKIMLDEAEEIIEAFKGSEDDDE